MAGHGANPLSHVQDSPHLEIPWFSNWPEMQVTWHLPQVLGIQITKFMVMEVVAALLVVAIMVPMARMVARRPVTKGRFGNAFEAMLLFIRDEVARPSIGGHGADEYLPFLWTVFFFVLFCNLLGMIPGLASATGNINVTFALAMMTLAMVILAGVKQAGFVGYWVGLVPHLDVPPWLKPFLWVLMFFIEIAGLLIRHVVLAVRLFANMFAGHMVLAVILGFILMAWHVGAFYLVMPASVLGVIALSLLELFVAFLQAYIFTFLSALFIGTSVHPH
ncbi:ATP synthase subunit a [Aquisphaera giovannonii]|uniref:ATP synthase subunit a n=1 Tax=Aquisphaera giovannonii TaxID=406548 RepID=A0A5B9W264_9BACT|nr:F0F1 ATP synthase subunit A [Aquisphaera giovannonii]QEH34080.1 ATP synthase subunit a [Aquisphaera giovannonii]